MTWFRRQTSGEAQMLGNTAMAAQNFSDAEAHYRRAIELASDKAVHQLSLGVVLFEQGRLDEALPALERARVLEPGGGEADFFLGRISAQKEDSAAAAAHFRNALISRPRFEQALSALMALVLSTGQAGLAATTLDELVARDPAWAKIHHGLGIVAMMSQNTDQAIAEFQLAIALGDQEPEFYVTLIDVLLYLGRPEEALAASDDLIQVAPEMASSHLQRGRALEMLARLDDSAAAFLRAIELDATLVLAQYSLANALTRLGRRGEAIEAFQRVLVLVPGYQDARYLLAAEQLEAGRAVDATASLRQAAKEQPGRTEIWGHLAHGAWADLDWRDRAHIENESMARVALGERAAAPFDFLLISDSARLQQQCAIASAPAAQPALAKQAYATHRKLRIAYLSPDFRHHAVSFLMAGVFECHDRDAFEIVGMGWGPGDGSPIGVRVRDAFDQFIDISQISDEGVARLLLKMEIDIAVDLAGRTHRGRPGIFAWHGAAIQVNYLGFPATLGAPYMDYIVADRYTIPEISEPFYTERAVILPVCFQANDSSRSRPRDDLTREMFGLPNDAFVFCCLNSTPKVSPALFDVWMRLLLANPASVLWALCNSDAARANLFEEAQKRGVNRDRLVTATDVDYDQHVARQMLADLGLDTFPFNGGTSISDSLWAGLPVVTCSGEAFASRMAGSILRAVGLAELVTDSLQEYESVAMRLTVAREELGALRERLQHNRISSPLFSSKEFSVALERAYQEMWRRSVDDAQPGAIVIDAV